MPEWKSSGKLAFGQVPLLQDGDFNLVQSNTIARYLARKYDLYGNEKAGAVSDMIIDGQNDFLSKLIPAVYPKFDQAKLDELKKEAIPNFLGSLEKILDSYSEFLGGDKLVLGDLALYLITEGYISEYKFASEEDYPNLVAHMKKVAANENLAKYINGDKRFPVRPLQ